MKNVPNLLSTSRMIVALFVFILIILNQPWAFLVATALFLLASMTDYFDGLLARRYRLVSPIGIFLDLTADKVFISTILVALVQIGLIPAWVVAIIVAREFLVSGLRSMAAAKGKVIPAGRWGKQKMFITLVAVNVLLLAKGLGAHLLSLFPPALAFTSQTLQVNEIFLLMADALILLAVLWTIISGVEYTRDALPLLRERPPTPAVSA